MNFRYRDTRMKNSTTEVSTVENKLIIDENGNVVKSIKNEQTKKFKYFGKLLELDAEIVWGNVIGFLILHLIAIYGLIYFFSLILFSHRSTSFYIFHYLSVVIYGQGITAGAHRLFSHKAYKTNLPLRILLLSIHTLAGQNCMYVWVRDHRQHHKYTDTDADPHNAKKGFFFSHMGWLMMRKHPEVIKKGKTIDLTDMEQDPIIMFQKKYYLYLFWAGQVFVYHVSRFCTESSASETILLMITRYVFILHCTWAVNSFAHLHGMKPYDKHIMPVENHCVSIFSNGEGWHNYHHSFPWDYKASELGVSNNFTTSFIDFFAKVGWAYDLKIASEEIVAKRISRKGDGSHKSIKKITKGNLIQLS